MTKPMTDEEYTEQVYAFIDLCLSALSDECVSLPKLAVEMGLSPQSLRRAARHDTRYFRILTIQKIGHRAGFELFTSDSKLKMRVVRKRKVA